VLLSPVSKGRAALQKAGTTRACGYTYAGTDLDTPPPSRTH